MKHIVYSGLSEARRAALLRRPAAKEQEAIARRVAALEGEILQEGDAALRRFARQFDGVDLQPLQFAVERPVWQTAWEHLPAELQTALQTALRNIAKFHRSELPRRREAVVETTAGVHCWREFRAIDTVGLYIPGGSAPLFSTMLMLGIPAIIAGCREIIFCSPPLSAAGKPYAPKKGIYAAEEMLACMELLYRFSAEAANSQELPSVPRLRYFQLGGAGAIFALAYGKEAGCSVPAAAKIFGPGNAYVTEAKLRISRRVAIDMPAGPSEVLVIADDAARPQVVAADLLAQAEHGPNSQVILASPSAALLGKVEAEVARQAARLPRSQEIQGTLANSYLIETRDIAEALAFSNEYAPEHLILATSDYQPLLAQVRNAGSVFCGPYASESFGDYASGTNHTLPTSGFGRSHSGLNTESFGRWLTFQSVAEEGLRLLGPTVELLAAREQLEAHKNAVSLRLQGLE